MNETNPPEDGEIEDLVSNRLSEADKYYLEQAHKEPVERIGRIEDVAKFMAGATATTSGLYLAAFKIALGPQTAKAFIWVLPFLLWAVSLVLFVLVLLPRNYPVLKNDPNSWRMAFTESGKLKYRLLLAGAVFFIGGILTGAWLFQYILQ